MRRRREITVRSIQRQVQPQNKPENASQHENRKIRSGTYRFLFAQEKRLPNQAPRWQRINLRQGSQVIQGTFGEAALGGQ